MSRTPAPVSASSPVVVDLPDRSSAAVDRAEAV
jgi:hypothetical protein